MWNITGCSAVDSDIPWEQSPWRASAGSGGGHQGRQHVSELGPEVGVLHAVRASHEHQDQSHQVLNAVSRPLKHNQLISHTSLNNNNTNNTRIRVIRCSTRSPARWNTTSSFHTPALTTTTLTTPGSESSGAQRGLPPAETQPAHFTRQP